MNRQVAMGRNWGIAVLILLALGWAAGLAGPEGQAPLAVALATAAVLYVCGWGMAGAAAALRRGRYLAALALPGLVAGLGLYGYFSVWALRPAWLPQQNRYDLIANHHVTARLVDPSLLKVETWEIVGRAQQVLFVHPSAAGSTALVYPVRIEPHSVLRAELALAPGAWAAEGDGVEFAVYVEDEAGMHLRYSRYVDPKHHQQDRAWLPMAVDLSPFAGKLVRIIMAVNSGPAGDVRFDWAGWGRPRLERPVWP